MAGKEEQERTKDVVEDGKGAEQQILFDPKHHPLTGKLLHQTLVHFGNPSVELIQGCIYKTMGPDESHPAEVLEEKQHSDFTDFGQSDPDGRKLVGFTVVGGAQTEAESSGGELEENDLAESDTIHVFDIPAHVNISEFYQFIADFQTSITHTQVLLNTNDPSDKYDILLKFRSLEDATDFCKV